MRFPYDGCYKLPDRLALLAMHCREPGNALGVQPTSGSSTLSTFELSQSSHLTQMFLD